MWYVLLVEIIGSLSFVYCLYHYKCPTIYKMMAIGVSLTVITCTLYDMHIHIACIATGISGAGGALILESAKNILVKEDNLKLSGDWRKNLYKLEQNKNYRIGDLYELSSYINPYSDENVVSIIVNQVIVSILSCYSKSEKIQVENFNEIENFNEKFNEKFNKKKNLQGKKIR